MMAFRKSFFTITLVGILLVLVSACAGRGGLSSERAAPTCAELLRAAVQYERSGSDQIDVVLQALSDRCSDEYEIAVDYLANSTDGEFNVESCDQLLGYGIRSEAVELLAQDGYCSFGEAQVPPKAAWPNGGLGWDEARGYAGTAQRVCGPLVSIRETDDGTFVNIGRDYPSVDRFTIIFWGVYLEPIEPGATLCAAGDIYLYEGVAQIEMWDPTSLEIWR